MNPQTNTPPNEPTTPPAAPNDQSDTPPLTPPPMGTSSSPTPTASALDDTVVPPPAVPPSDETRGYLVAFILTITPFAVLGLRPFYTRDKVGGIIRLALFVGGMLLLAAVTASFYTPIPIITSLSVIDAVILTGMGLLGINGIWAIVDFFYTFFYFRSGKHGLHASTSEKRWATIIFILTLLCYIIGLIQKLSN